MDVGHYLLSFQIIFIRRHSYFISKMQDYKEAFKLLYLHENTVFKGKNGVFYVNPFSKGQNSVYDPYSDFFDRLRII